MLMHLLVEKLEKIGFTLLGQRNSHAFFDADKDGFSDMPMQIHQKRVRKNVAENLSLLNKLIAQKSNCY